MPDFINTSETMGSEAAVLDALIAHNLASFSDNNIVTLGDKAFYKNDALINIELPSLINVGANTFEDCTALTTAIFSTLKTLGLNMFKGCTSLTSLSFPELTTTNQYAFYSCTSLQSITFPLTVTTFANYLFTGCTALVTITAQGLTSVGTDVFSGCSNLTTVELSNVTSIGNYAFQNCGKLNVVALPACTSIGHSLSRDYGPAGFDFTKNVTIVANAFNKGYNMQHLVLRSNQAYTLRNVNAFTDTPIAAGLGYIYVPADLVDTYKAASNWTTYAAQIQPISAYPKTPTGSISDTWAQILEAEQNGTYSSKYAVGDTKVVDIDGTSVLMKIVAMDTDVLTSDSTQTAPITWISAGVLETRVMNATDTASGGWADSAMRTYLRETLLPKIESTVRLNIKEVNKTYRTGTPTNGTLTAADTVWIPSYREIFGGTSYENSGVDYTTTFDSTAKRTKRLGSLGCGDAKYWWLRSVATAASTSGFQCVNDSGGQTYYKAISIYGLVLGFCT